MSLNEQEMCHLAKLNHGVNLVTCNVLCRSVDETCLGLKAATKDRLFYFAQHWGFFDQGLVYFGRPIEVGSVFDMFLLC